MQLTVDGSAVEVGSRTVRPPYPPDGDVCVLDGVGVVRLIPNLERNEDPDFSLPAPHRNVVALDERGELCWTIREPPNYIPVADSGWTSEDTIDDYRHLFTLGGSLYAVHDATERLYEVDHETGELLGSLAYDHVPLGDTPVQLDGPIRRVVDCGDLLAVETGIGGVPDDAYGFDPEGNELWRLTEDHRGTLYCRDGTLHERTANSIGGEYYVWYRLDHGTGERIEVVTEGHLAQL